jgi:hypothetical protein
MGLPFKYNRKLSTAAPDAPFLYSNVREDCLIPTFTELTE